MHRAQRAAIRAGKAEVEPTTAESAFLHVSAEGVAHDLPLASLDQAGVRHQGSSAWTPTSVSLDLLAGQFVGLIGPSGCGKSSVSLTLNGLVPHSVPSHYRGSVQVCGREVADTRICDLATSVAMVMQDPDAQIVTTTVLDEVRYALENLCMESSSIDQRARAALADVGLGEWAAVDPWELSGGMRQRLALACALALQPQLLVLDEPTANIDPRSGREIYRLLAEQVANGVGVLVIEHDLDPVVAHLDWVIALGSDGTVLTSGPPSEVFQKRRDVLIEAGIWLPTAVRLADAVPQFGQAGALSLSHAIKVVRSQHEAAARLRDYHKALFANPQPIAAPAALSITGLQVQRGDGRKRRTVLDGIDLTIPAGTVTAVVGPNGSGKSTLLEAIAGLNPHTMASSYLVAGQSVKPGRPHQDIGYVFQNPQHQFLHPTVEAELAHAWRLRGFDANHIGPQVDRLLADFDLTHCRDRNPFLLSGGQQRRLSVASVFGEARTVLCLDEPTFGQDHRSATALVGLLHRVAETGTAVVIATHDMDLVANHATHLVVINDGQVVAAGSPEEVFDDPKSSQWLELPPSLSIERGTSSIPPVSTPARPPATRPGAVARMLERVDIGRRLGPITLFLGCVPLLVAIFGAQYPALSFITLCAGSLTMIALLGLPLRNSLTRLAVLGVLATLLGWSGALSYRFDLHGLAPGRVGPFNIDLGQWHFGLRVGSRVGAILMLIILTGSASQATQLLRMLVTHLRLPVRIGYAGMAAVSFTRRFQADHRTIRQARRLRGSAWDRVGLGGVSGWFGSLIPLLVGAIRHAERVSMSMDARAFGAYSTRTDADPMRWRLRDTLTVLGLWLATALTIWILSSTGLWGGWRILLHDV